MYSTLPKTSEDFETLTWSEIEPWYKELTQITLTEETVQEWLLQWSQLIKLIDEVKTRQQIAVMWNTVDEERLARKQRFLEEIDAPAQSYEQQLKELILASGLEPEGFAIPLRKLHTETNIFREANLPLFTEEKRLFDEYTHIGSSQTVEWEGQEIPVISLLPVYEEKDRERREKAWRLGQQRKLADRRALNNIWIQLVRTR